MKAFMFTVMAMLLAASAFAHVVVAPQQSQAGASQVYKVRVHNDEKTAGHLGRARHPRRRHRDERGADGRRKINHDQDGRPHLGHHLAGAGRAWKVRGARLYGHKPPSGQLQWNVREHFADGSVTEWSDKPGSGRQGVGHQDRRSDTSDPREVRARSMFIDWNPIAHVGPIPINWYGLTWALGFLIGGAIVRRRSARYGIRPDQVETAVLWIAVGTLIGARLYYVVQNDVGEYLRQPWRVLAFWEGGLAHSSVGCSEESSPPGCMPAGRRFRSAASLICSRQPCRSDPRSGESVVSSMEWTMARLPGCRGVSSIRTPNSYAPNDGVPRHPDQVYELIGDLIIAALLFKLRNRFSHGSLFLLYLILFSVLRFFLFFVRGNVPIVAFGLKNGQLTALAILVIAIPIFMRSRMFQKS